MYNTVKLPTYMFMYNRCTIKVEMYNRRFVSGVIRGGGAISHMTDMLDDKSTLDAQTAYNLC